MENNTRVTILPKNECTVQTVTSVTVPVKEEVKQILKDKCLREATENFLKNFGDVKINTNEDCSIVMRVVTEYDIPVTLDTINKFSECMKNRSAEFIGKVVEFLKTCRNYKNFVEAYKKDLDGTTSCEKEALKEKKKEQYFDVILIGYDSGYRLAVVKEVKKTLNINLQQASDIVWESKLPAILSTNVDYNTACKIKISVECDGHANVIIKPTELWK